MKQREIKFRAWDGKQMIFVPAPTVYAISRFFGFITDETPLMQYTGLKDKNGKEIYDGDKFLEENSDEYYMVEWNSKESRFQVNLYGHAIYTGENSQEVESNDISMIDGNCIEMSLLTTMEIRGNKYNSPDK